MQLGVAKVEGTQQTYPTITKLKYWRELSQWMKWIIADLDLSKNLSCSLLKDWKLITIEKFVFRAHIRWAKMWIVNSFLGGMLWIVIIENWKLKDRGAKVRR